jgi:hypothetical protein
MLRQGVSVSAKRAQIYDAAVSLIVTECQRESA